jgi:hypothetical protein
MSPVHDPRFSKQQRVEWTQQDSMALDADRSWLYCPLGLLCGGLIILTFWPVFFYEITMTQALVSSLAHCIALVILVPIGFLAMVITSLIFKDSAGNLWLSFLRLAAVFIVGFTVPIITGAGCFSIPIQITVMAVLIAWLFEWDLMQGGVMTILCWIIQFLAASGIITLIGVFGG